MEISLYRYILRHSLKQQVALVCLTAAALPFYYASLDLPKRIINEAISPSAAEFPRPLSFAGFEITRLQQLDFLVTLCGVFLFLVLINGGFKYVINVYKGLLGERMLRRLRYQLFSMVLRFPLPHLRKVSQGQLVAMIAGEVEPLGGFIGDAFALPLYQGGLLITALVFIAAQDLLMGLAVIALYPVQAVVIPRLQYQVNQLGKRRVQEIRRLSDKISETVSLVREIRVDGTSRFERANITNQLGRIFDIRYQIFRKKFFIKFLNNFLAQFTPFLFFSVGGYLVIIDDLTIGALVAVLAAYKDLTPPWKELLDYYQDQQDARIKYEQIVSQFDVANLEPEDWPATDQDISIQPEARLVARDVTVEDEGVTLLDSASFEIGFDEHVAVIGGSASGKEAMAALIVGLIEPSAGSVSIEDTGLGQLPSITRSRWCAYVDSSPAFLAGSVIDNMVYGLKHTPSEIATLDATAETEAKTLAEARASGNSMDDPTADWVDYAAVGSASPAEVADAAMRALLTAEMEDDLFDFGLRAVIDPAQHTELVAGILRARSEIRGRLAELGDESLVEPFDPERFNDNATLAENLIFGEIVDGGFDPRRMAENRYVRKILRKAKLERPLLELGYDIAKTATTVELNNSLASSLGELAPIRREDLPLFATIVSRVTRARVRHLPRRERRLLESLPFFLIAARHRNFPIDETIRARVVEARRAFAAGLPKRLAASISFLDEKAYNPTLSIRDNILFGRIAFGQATAVQAIRNLIRDVIDDLNLRSQMMTAGLHFHVGVGGSRLSPAQRQKLAVARAIFKQPRLIVLVGASVGLDPGVRQRLRSKIRQEFQGRGLLWVLNDPGQAAEFERVLYVEGGQVREQESPCQTPDTQPLL